MRGLILGLVAAGALASASFVAAPASAQEAGVVMPPMVDSNGPIRQGNMCKQRPRLFHALLRRPQRQCARTPRSQITISARVRGGPGPPDVLPSSLQAPQPPAGLVTLRAGAAISR